MTTKQLQKLETRIATLKATHRIIWIEGISAEMITGKINGKACQFVKADSLNANGGCWYYIVRWNDVEWTCSCEAMKPCKHEKAMQARCNAKAQNARRDAALKEAAESSKAALAKIEEEVQRHIEEEKAAISTGRAKSEQAQISTLGDEERLQLATVPQRIADRPVRGSLYSKSFNMFG